VTSLNEIDRVAMRSTGETQLFLRRTTKAGQLVVVMMKRRRVVVETRRERRLCVGIGGGVQVVEAVMILLGGERGELVSMKGE
jgi:hypothetical protein